MHDFSSTSGERWCWHEETLGYGRRQRMVPACGGLRLQTTEEDGAASSRCGPKSFVAMAASIPRAPAAGHSVTSEQLPFVSGCGEGRAEARWRPCEAPCGQASWHRAPACFQVSLDHVIALDARTNLSYHIFSLNIRANCKDQLKCNCVGCMSNSGTCSC
jgi:hypothetical protein